MSTEQDLVFDTPEPIGLYVENGRGSVDITATDTTETTIRITGDRADEFDVRDLADEPGPHRIAVLAPRRTTSFLGKEPRVHIAIEVPVASSLEVKVGSSSLTTRGRLHDVRVDSGSGDVTLDVVRGDTLVKSGSGDVVSVDLAGDARIKTGSGDVLVRRSGSNLVVTTGSGDVRVESGEHDLAVKTGSGDAQVDSLAGDGVFTTGSGDVAVLRVGVGRVTAKTASGDVWLGVLPGTPVWTDVRTASGRLSSNLPSMGEPEAGQPYLELRASTASGDVTLQQV